jgi:hypothetical protein
MNLDHSFFPVGGRKTRILDFDIENRPLTYWQPDRPTADITAIASCWSDDHDSMEVMLLGIHSRKAMLARFVERYNEADMVTGHYIRRHDLPIINGALYEMGMPILGSKLTSDTKLDMFTKADIPATQEYLLELLDPQCPLGLKLHKYHMSQGMWRAANRLTAEGVEETRTRVMSDVHSHIHMREAMLERGWLDAPRMWTSGGGNEVAEGRHR